MKINRIILILTIPFLIFLSSCDKADNSPTNPGGTNPTGGMAASVNGTNWSSVFTGAANYGTAPNTYMVITGTGALGADTLLIAITISNPAVGEFQFNSMDYFGSAVVYKNTQAADLYYTNLPNGSGTAKISSISSSAVSGTFNFVGVAPTGGATITVTNGSFNTQVVSRQNQ